MHREIMVKLPAELVDGLDRRAREWNVPRSALIRNALERYVADMAHADVDRRIIAGYTAEPQSDTWGDGSARSMIRDEPW